MIKIGIAIVLAIWIVLTIKGLFCYGFKKVLSINRFIFVVIFVGLFGIFTTAYVLPLILFLIFTKGMSLFLWLWLFISTFALPLGILLKNVKFNPFWIWLDDSRFDKDRDSGFSEDYEIVLNGKKETFWIAFNWHLRNMVWNLNEMFQPKKQNITEGNQNIKIVEVVLDTLVDGFGKEIPLNSIYERFAGLKFWKNGVSTWNTNKGEMISKEKSYIGYRIIWYKVEGSNSLWFQFSYCKIVRPFYFLWLWKGWRTLKLGTNSKRFVRTVKHQNDITWK